MFLKAVVKLSFREIFVEVKTKMNSCEILGEAQITKIKAREMFEISAKTNCLRYSRDKNVFQA